MNPYYAHLEFRENFARALEKVAADEEVVGFKSVVCYRTGLNVAVRNEQDDDFSAMVEQCVTMAYLKYEATRTIRLEYKHLNDYVVNRVLELSGKCGKPGAVLPICDLCGPNG